MELHGEDLHVRKDATIEDLNIPVVHPIRSGKIVTKT